MLMIDVERPPCIFGNVLCYFKKLRGARILTDQRLPSSFVEQHSVALMPENITLYHHNGPWALSFVKTEENGQTVIIIENSVV